MPPMMQAVNHKARSCCRGAVIVTTFREFARTDVLWPD